MLACVGASAFAFTRFAIEIIRSRHLECQAACQMPIRSGIISIKFNERDTWNSSKCTFKWFRFVCQFCWLSRAIAHIHTHTHVEYRHPLLLFLWNTHRSYYFAQAPVFAHLTMLMPSLSIVMHINNFRFFHYSNGSCCGPFLRRRISRLILPMPW